jgi:hypothetical protein
LKGLLHKVKRPSNPPLAPKNKNWSGKEEDKEGKTKKNT